MAKKKKKAGGAAGSSGKKASSGKKQPESKPAPAVAPPAKKEESVDSDDFMNAAAEAIEADNAKAAAAAAETAKNEVKAKKEVKTEESTKAANKKASKGKKGTATAPTAKAPAVAAPKDNGAPAWVTDAVRAKNKSFIGSDGSKSNGSAGVKPLANLKGLSPQEQNKVFLGSSQTSATAVPVASSNCALTPAQQHQVTALLEKIPPAQSALRNSLTTALSSPRPIVSDLALQALCDMYSVRAEAVVPVTANDKLKALIAAVPASEGSLRAALQHALTSKQQIISPLALDALYGIYVKGRGVSPEVSCPAAECAAARAAAAPGAANPLGPCAHPHMAARLQRLLDVLPAGDLRSAIELAWASKHALIHDKALDFLVDQHCGFDAVPPPAAVQGKDKAAGKEGGGKKGGKKTQTPAATKSDGTAEFFANAEKAKGKPAAGAGAGSADVSQLHAENMALKRHSAALSPPTAVTPCQTAGNMPCPLVASGLMNRGAAGLPATYVSWTVDEVVEWAIKEGIKSEMCEILRREHIDGPCLPDLTFDQLKGDGFTTGMALRLLRGVSGQ